MQQLDKALKKLIVNGYYADAENIILGITTDMQRETIMQLAYDTESMCLYSFLRYITEKYNTQFWKKLLIDVLINPLCFIEGAYATALFHSRELLSMNQSVENLELIIFFYNIPEKLIDYDETLSIAKMILAVDHNNAVALGVIKDGGTQ